MRKSVVNDLLGLQREINKIIPTTIEEDYTYRMRRLMKKFVGQYEELQGLDAEELQDKIWNDYAKEFGHMVLEDMSEFSGDELFEF